VKDTYPACAIQNVSRCASEERETRSNGTAGTSDELRARFDDGDYRLDGSETFTKNQLANDLEGQVKTVEEIFSTPSKGFRGEKVSVPLVDEGDSTDSRANHVTDEDRPALGLSGGVPDSVPVSGGFTLLDYRVTQSELSGLTEGSFDVDDSCSYHYKFVISGDIVELYTYESEQLQRKGKKQSGERKKHTLEEKEGMKEQNYYRAGKACRRLINTNVNRHGIERPKFLTFTFKEDIRDFKTANYEWTKFVQRLEYRIGFKARYVVVPEFQDKSRDGVIHYHAIFFNVPYIPANPKMDTRGLGYNLADIWGLGFVKINAIDRVNNVGTYVTAYMTEDIEDERYQGAKKYFASRGLFKHKEFITADDDLVDEVMQGIEGKRTYESDFENDYVGKVHYEQFNKNKGERRHEKAKKRTVECNERGQENGAEKYQRAHQNG
jgi:hypothetical protein